MPRPDDQVGSQTSGAVFPRYGEQWFECYICGFAYPNHIARKHFRSKRLVCGDCDDQWSHSDYLAAMTIPTEIPTPTEQRVSCQGEVVDDSWYSLLWYEGEWYGQGDECEYNTTIR
jgi:hypothetical protein